MKTNIFSKRIFMLFAFCLAIVSAAFLFMIAPKRPAKAEDPPTDFSAYRKITDETITKLGGVVIAFEDSVDTVFSGLGHVGVVLVSVAEFGIMSFDQGVGGNIDPLSLEDTSFLDDGESDWNLYYIPHIFVSGSSEVDIDSWDFDISNDIADISFYAAVQPVSVQSENISVSNNGLSIVFFSTVTLILSAVAIVSVIKLFGYRRH